MTPFKENITKSIDNLNKLQEDVENTITDLQEQVVDLEEQVEDMENLETKNVTITTNTETIIEPTTGKYALDKVVVTTNVASDVYKIKYGKELFAYTNASNRRRYDLKNMANAGELDGLLDASYMLALTSGGTYESDALPFPFFNAENITDASNMFSNSRFPSSVTNEDRTLPQLYFKNITNALNMFKAQSTTSTTKTFYSLPCTIGPGVTNLQNFCLSCADLIQLPTFEDTSHCTTFNSAFYSCTSLVDFPILNLSANLSSSGLSNFVGNCVSLSDNSLHNIIKSLLTVTSSTITKTLAHIGLSDTQATTCTSFDEWATLSANGWATGY